MYCNCCCSVQIIPYYSLGFNNSNCWPLLSNQSLFRQFASYVMGLDDPRVIKLMMKGGYEPTKINCYMPLLGVHPTMHFMHAPQVSACNYY